MRTYGAVVGGIKRPEGGAVGTPSFKVLHFLIHHINSC